MREAVAVAVISRLLRGRAMTFRLKLTLLTAAAIGLTVAGASGATWVVATHQLRGQVDDALRVGAQQALFGDHHGPGPFEPGTALQSVAADGTAPAGLPVLSGVRDLAEGKTTQPFFTDTHVISQNTNVHARVYAVPSPDGGAIAIWRNVNDTDKALHRIGLALSVIGASGIALAAALAALVAAAALRPIRRLTAAAKNVATTGNLSERVDARSNDELGRLAEQFNEMLAALEKSMDAQRHLVADASHELRTPLTAARTNVDLVLEGRLPQEEARLALSEASVELNSLTSLIADLVELARGQERKLRMEEVRLDEIVESAVERAGTRAPAAIFVTALSPTSVRADASLLERAISNLLDNAVKYSPQGAPIEVSVRAGEVVVQDHGSGITAADLPRVFDRFYRADTARGKPGAGLGLAIVRAAAEAHGGTANAETTTVGARFTLALPTLKPAG
jgi:two-component system, OmpR family, sensor histidine kinase MprB